VFEARLKEVEQRFPGDEIPRPENWSGWRVAPDVVEFWREREFRLHERVVFKRAGTGWETGLLYP